MQGSHDQHQNNVRTGQAADDQPDDPEDFGLFPEDSNDIDRQGRRRAEQKEEPYKGSERAASWQMKRCRGNNRQPRQQRQSEADFPKDRSGIALHYSILSATVGNIRVLFFLFIVTDRQLDHNGPNAKKRGKTIFLGRQTFSCLSPLTIFHEKFGRSPAKHRAAATAWTANRPTAPHRSRPRRSDQYNRRP
jgi:hypothetical protein